MSSNSHKQSSSLIDPIIDLFVLLIEVVIDLGIFLIEKLFGYAVSKLKAPPQEMITADHLKYKKSSVDPKDLGMSAVTKKAIKLQELKTHLHTLLIGSSGWGKSNTLNLLFENSIDKDLPIIFVDPKGSRSAIREFSSMCEFYEKECFIFSELSNENIFYDLYYGLELDEIVTAVMRSLDWSEPYYQARSQSFLFKTIKHLDSKGIPVTLISIYEYLENNHKDDKELAGLKAQLEMIVHSSFAKLIHFTKDDVLKGRVISLPEIKNRRACLYLGLSTQGKGDIARVFGKLILNGVLMLSHYAGINYDSSEDAIENGLSFFLDEAGSMVFPDFIELLNKCRSSGIQVYACVQSLADFDCVSPEFKKQCFENFATTIILKQGEPENAQYLSQSIGTLDSIKKTSMQEEGSETGRGSVRDTKEYICHPDVLRKIGIGKIVMVTRNPYKVDLINVRYVSDSEAFQVNTELNLIKPKVIADRFTKIPNKRVQIQQEVKDECSGASEESVVHVESTSTKDSGQCNLPNKVFDFSKYFVSHEKGGESHHEKS